MAVRSGLGAQLGLATETTYGTYVAPTTFYPITSVGGGLSKEYIRSAGLRAGRLAQSSALHVATTRAVDGSVERDMLQKGEGKWLNLLHGNTVSPVQIGTTLAYRQTHEVGLTDPYNKSVSMQGGKPDTSGTVRPFTWLGSKVMSVTFSLERGGIVTSSWDIDAQDETTAQSLGTATYVANALPFTFQSGSIEVDDVVLTDCVRSYSLSIEIPHETDRYCINSSATKQQPIINDQVSVTAELEVEFASLTQYTAFTNATRRKLELRNNQGDAGGSNPFALNFTMPATVITDGDIPVDGPDVLTSTWTFEALDDGSLAPLSIEYVSTDTAL